MSIHWERLFGDTGKFALRIAFLEDPLPDPVQPRELAASWGRFSLYVHGRNLTRNEGLEEKTEEGVNWYLLPLLEWLVANWDPIFHEERLPASTRIARGPAATALRETATWLSEDPETHGEALDARWRWWRRHSMDSCREGGILPRVAFRRYQDDLEVSWEPVDYGHRRFDLPAGAARVPAADAASVFIEALRSCIEVLRAVAPDSERIDELSRRVDSIRSPRAARPRILWLAGWDPTSDAGSFLSKRFARRKALKDARLGALPAFMDVESPGKETPLVLPHAVPTLLFRSVAPTVSPEDLIEIRLAALRCRIATDKGRWREFVPAPMSEDQPPWQQGYAFAGSLRRRMQLQAEPIGDMRALLKGIDVAVETIPLEDSSIRALCLRGPEYRPTIFLNENARTYRYRWAKRMDLAHELAHLLLDGAAAKPVAVVSGPWAPISLEQRANAFAAMFLLPEEAIRTELGPRGFEPGPEGVERLMDKYGVGATTATWHLANLGWIDDQERELLLHELGGSR